MKKNFIVASDRPVIRAGALLSGPQRCHNSSHVSLGWGAATDLLRGRLDWDAWLRHGLGVALVLTWALAVCGLSLLDYLVYFAWPGIALTLLRSFLEHQARQKVGERTVIVEAEAPLALMFFNNNLHSAHHAHPGASWYRLPRLYRQQRATYLTENSGYLFRGYRQVVRRYLFTPKEPVGHPL